MYIKNKKSKAVPVIILFKSIKCSDAIIAYMVDVFHWVIFLFHFSAALTITFGVWLRCDPDVWVSRMRVDTYHVQVNSSGLWWKDRSASEVLECSWPNATDSRRCFDADLPLYEREPGDLGWHLFVLLGHFEWISSAFAFFYVRYPLARHSWWICIGFAGVGTVIFMPFRGTLFVNEVVLLWINFCVCVGVFLGYKSLHDVKNAPQRPQPPSDLLANASISGEGDLVASRLQDVQLVALRFAEYCITASELWVAVLAVFVQDPPAFMTLGGYTLILLTNLYGILLHYSLVSDNVQAKLEGGASAWLPPQMSMKPLRRGLRVPVSMLGQGGLGISVTDSFRNMMQRRVWGSYIASNTSTLLNSWLAYLIAIGLIFYQQTFLFSSDPPVFVVFAGWSLIVSYSSFGIWMTLVYWYPGVISRWCCCFKDKEVYSVAVHGLDILSLSSKLSIVGSLSYGFVFRAEGRC